MKWMRLLGYLCVSSALLALAPAAQARDGLTPAEETMCDPLADATPGLYGICVAICEAQRCVGIYDGDQVTFDPGCKPSAESLFDNYQKKATLGDPPLPCVKPACPCWSESEIDAIGGLENGSGTLDSCRASSTNDSVFMNGFATEGSGQELAYALETGAGLRCIRMEMSPFTWEDKTIDAEAFRTCRDSVLAQCQTRGVPVR